MRTLTITALLAALAVPVVAQEQEIRNANLPGELEYRLLRMYDGDARRIEGPATVDRLQVVNGDVAVVGGPFRVAGRIMGDLAMVGGDVIIEPGGSVTGDVTVVGGEVRLTDNAEVRGTITAYGTTTRARRYTRHVDRRSGDDARDREDRWQRRSWNRGFSRLTLRTGASYNRVEGLPVMFGPVLQTAGANPLRLEALAIWRSEMGASLETERMGYQVRAEQFLGGNRVFSVGGSAYSVIDPLDRWQVGDLEASLAAAVLHEDYRDHFGRAGWSAFATVSPVRGAKARVEYRREDHTAVAVGDPWALFDEGAFWRDQPIIGQGTLELVTGALELDYRDDRGDPDRGWFARFEVNRPVGGALTRPQLLFVRPVGEAVVTDVMPAAELSTDFTTALIDIRRYTPVAYRSQVNFRVVAGGSVDERGLPPQFQHALGGLGTLPGYATLGADCGARRATGRFGGERYFTSYGCDRFVLGQAEYRGRLSLDFGFGDPDYDDDGWWDDVRVDLSPTWVVFFDAARGWAYADPLSGGTQATATLYDAGLGFLIEDVGFYAALPLSGGVEQEPRFFIRLGRRF